MSSIDKSAFQKELFKCINPKISPKELRANNFGKLKLPDNVLTQIKKNKLCGIQKNNDEIIEQINQQENENEFNENRLIIDRNIIEVQIQEKNEGIQEKNKSRNIVQQINNTEIHQQENENEMIEDRVIIDVADQIQEINKRKQNFDELIARKKPRIINYKDSIIKEFDKLYNYNNFNVNNRANDSINENITEEKINIAYEGTKIDNFTKWLNLKLFLNLTKSKTISELCKILNLKYDNVSKKVQTFKKAMTFLSYIDEEKYDQITICITYFQKINKMDWNEVLKHMMQTK